MSDQESGVKYRVVSLGPNGWQAKEYPLTKESFIKEMEALGHGYLGDNSNPRQREILQNQPKFSGFNGPMYDGEGWVRYEDNEAYDALSR